jgi:hypothetical protein
MDDQLHEDRRATEYLSHRKVSETFLQLRLEVHDLKESLQHNQASKRRQSLILKPQARNGVPFCSNVFSARLHLLTSVFFAMD